MLASGSQFAELAAKWTLWTGRLRNAFVLKGLVDTIMLLAGIILVWIDPALVSATFFRVFLIGLAFYFAKSFLYLAYHGATTNMPGKKKASGELADAWRNDRVGFVAKYGHWGWFAACFLIELAGYIVSFSFAFAAYADTTAFPRNKTGSRQVLTLAILECIAAAIVATLLVIGAAVFVVQLKGTNGYEKLALVTSKNASDRDDMNLSV